MKINKFFDFGRQFAGVLLVVDATIALLGGVGICAYNGYAVSKGADAMYLISGGIALGVGFLAFLLLGGVGDLLLHYGKNIRELEYENARLREEVDGRQIRSLSR